MPTYPDCSYVSAADTSEPTGASYIYCLAAEVRKLKHAAVDLARAAGWVGGGFGSILLPTCDGTTVASMETALLTLESTDGNCFIQTAPYGDYSQIYVGTWGFTPGDLWVWSEAEPVPDDAYGAYIFQFYRSFTLAEIVAALNAALSIYSTFTAAVAGTADGTASILRMGVVIKNPPNGTFEADTAYDLVGACCVPIISAPEIQLHAQTGVCCGDGFDTDFDAPVTWSAYFPYGFLYITNNTTEGHFGRPHTITINGSSTLASTFDIYSDEAGFFEDVDFNTPYSLGAYSGNISMFDLSGSESSAEVTITSIVLEY